MGMFSWFRKPSKKSPKDKTENVNKPESRGRGRRRGYPDYPDQPTMLDRNAYAKIYEQSSCYTPLLKRARKCALFAPVVVGGGDTGKELQDILDESIALPHAQEFLSYTDVEGVRFLWLRTKQVGKMNVLDATGCGEKKIKAGGRYWWGGYDSPDVVQLASMLTPLREGNEDTLLDRSRLLVSYNSAIVNPEGDTTLGMNLFSVARAEIDLERAETAFAQKFSIPRPILEMVMREFSSEDTEGTMQRDLDLVAGASGFDAIATDAEKALKLLETNGNTWKFLSERRIMINGIAHKLVTGENLSTDSSGSGDTGSSEQAERQFFSSAVYTMRIQSEHWSRDVMPFLLDVNSHWMTPLRKKDRMWIEFRPVQEKHRLSVAEMVQSMREDIPLAWPTVYEVLGVPMPAGVEEEHGPYYQRSKMMPADAKPEGDKLNEGGTDTQRGDRDAKDGTGKQRKQEKKDDLRNADEEDEDGEDN